MTVSVLITGARAPVALDLARAFRACGHAVHLADSVPAFAARSLDRPVHRLPAPRQAFAAFRAAVGALLARQAIDLVVPTCEEVFYLAEAARRDGWADRLFAPPPDLLARLHSKAAVVALAGSLGLSVPQTVLLDAPVTAASLPWLPERMVLKPEFSRFATATRISPDAATLARIAPSPARRWVAQEKIEGEEICSWASLRAGRITAFAAYRPRWRSGRSAAFQVEAVDRPAVRAITETLGAATGLTGQLAFDVIVEPSGRAVLIECNPRSVSGLHLFDADAGLAAAITGAGAAEGPPAGRLRHLGPAMALVGLPSALIGGRLGGFLADWRAGRCAIARPGQAAALAGCLADAGHFALAGLFRRMTPAEATTADIAWDGEAMP